MATKAKQPPKQKKNWLPLLVRTIWVAFLGGLGLFVGFVMAINVDLFGLFGGLPGTDQLENPTSEVASEIYFADGVRMGKYFRQNRTPVKFDELSPNLVKALYATEDIRFDEHSGVDFKGLGRVAWGIGKYAVTLGKSDLEGGGSTISQQLAKILFGTRNDPRYSGPLLKVPGLGMLIIKIKEWITAVKLERAYTKQEILTMYLNQFDFLYNADGILVASQTYFNKTPDQLSVEEAAVLVGMLKNPSLYSPVKYPERSLSRRNTVMSQMVKYDLLAAEAYDTLKAKPIKLRFKIDTHNEGPATYYRSYIQNYLVNWAKENGYDLYEDGLRIYTTLDSRMQQYAEEAMEEHMKYQQAIFFQHWKGRNPWVNDKNQEIPGFLDVMKKRTPQYRELKKEYGNNTDSIDYYMKKPRPMQVFSWTAPGHVLDTIMSPMDSLKYTKHFLHSGLMSMDPHTGEVKAWVGGIDHQFFKYDHVRQGRRQPGSTFKAAVYTAAIDNGYTPCHPVYDLPTTFQVGDTTYIPKNSGGDFTGEKMTIRQGLAQSKNSVSAFLVRKFGPQTVVDYARRLGITSPLDPVPSIALGTSEISVYEAVGMYSTFVNQGTWTEPYTIQRIEDKNGNVLKTFNPKVVDAISPRTAYTMLYMLMGATQEKNGTALGLYSRSKVMTDGNQVAAKTGTTDNYSDGWFTGVTKDLVTSVWVGGEERSIHFRTFEYGQGARLAMPIWAKYMDKVYADKSLPVKKGPFDVPEEYEFDFKCPPMEGDSINLASETEAPQPTPNTYVKPTQREDF
ncbi:penicillin-binding protein 1A [Catalinimonas alkaloidigena]|uniref:Penicillin-binding protein 1A n=1 Tax=Catalinimonas alkaloidigena TaxID=1075417 RepID=A0A1G9E770_9BACT|nr:transglycosylase domain-containing protein [Catalinimonas alkaloidigena]SDK71963.1 penicillin-binding protein 1A [Catalinimonas alkaloidigena]